MQKKGPKLTSAERASAFFAEVEASEKKSYFPGDVKTMLNIIKQAPGSDIEAIETTETAETDVRYGDVFWSPMLGGKNRPWIVLSVRADIVVAVGMTSYDSVVGAIQSECRYWPKSHIGTTVSVFTQDIARRNVTRPYTNKGHLRKVAKSISKLHGLGIGSHKSEGTA